MFATFVTLTSLFAPLAAQLLIFDDGGNHFIDQSDLQPSDSVLVRGAGSGPFDSTTVTIGNQAVLLDLTLESGGQVNLQTDARVLGATDVAAGAALRTSFGFPAGQGPEALGPMQVNGFAHISLGNFADVSVGTGGLLRVSGSAVLRSLFAEGTVSLRGNGLAGPIFPRVIEGDATFLGSLGTSFNPSLPLLESVEIGGTARFDVQEIVRAANCRFAENVEFAPGVHGRFETGNEFARSLVLEGDASATFVMRTSSIGFGTFTGQTLHLSGLDRSGAPMAVVVEQSSTSQLQIVQFELGLGSVFCPQPVPNSAGFSGTIEASGSLLSSDNLLILRAVEIPAQTFGFFVVGTEAADVSLFNERVCIGGNIGRYSSLGMNSGLDAMVESRIQTGLIAGNPATVPTSGSTFYFQFWHRDSSPFGPTSKFTEAIALTFE